LLSGAQSGPGKQAVSNGQKFSRQNRLPARIGGGFVPKAAPFFILGISL